MFIQPWDAALKPAEWQQWLAGTQPFGMLDVNNADPAPAPLIVPTHFTVAGEQLLQHLARPIPVWPHLGRAGEIRLARPATTRTSRRTGAPWRRAGRGRSTAQLLLQRAVRLPASHRRRPQGRRTSSLPSSPTCSRRAVTARSRPIRRRTGSGIRDLGSGVCGSRCCAWTPSSSTTTRTRLSTDGASPSVSSSALRGSTPGPRRAAATPHGGR